MTNSNLITTLIKSVSKATNILYMGVRRRTSTEDYPQEIKDGISTDPVEVRGSTVIGKVKVIAPMALAYEFGSGIWSEIGPRMKYPIVPVDANFLAFQWPAALEATAFSDSGDELVIPSAGGKVILPGVMHPGIRAQPYIQPTILEKADEVANIVGDDVLLSISATLGPDKVTI